MIACLLKDFVKDSFYVSVMLFVSFFSASVCSATVNKSTATVLVSTAGQNNWYDDTDKALHTFTVCDRGSGTPYSKYVPCNTDEAHDDYYSTDTTDERNVYPASQNFSIKASASASSGSMTKIKFEWISDNTGTPNDSSWKSPDLQSFTCSNTGTCTICVKGGSCANPVIPNSDLGVYPTTGNQRRFFFRVTFSSSSGDNITTGWDSTLDKFYRFVICGPACSGHTCEQYTPTITPSFANAPAGFCKGLNDTNGYYTIGWNYSNMPSTAAQTYYKVSLRKKGTTNPVYTQESNSSNYTATTFKVPSAWLTYGTTYEWQVQVKFKGQGCEWDAISPWSTGAALINVPHRYPVPAFTVKNGSNADCLAGGCSQSEDLNFNASASSTSTGNATYNWTLDGAAYSGVSFSKSFPDKKHTVRVKVTDSDGHSCTSPDKGFDLSNVTQTCEAGLSVSLGGVFKPINACDGLDDTDGYYAISWQSNNLPRGARQTHYEVTVRNKNMPNQTNTASADSSSTMFKIPASWVTYNNTYEWQVKVTIVSADEKCSWNLISPWSNEDINIIVPPHYPEPDFRVDSNDPSCGCMTDCLFANCKVGSVLNFNAGTSRIYIGKPTYEWIIDGVSYTGLTLSKSFTDKNHKVSLKVTDGAGSSCSTPVDDIILDEVPCPEGPTTALAVPVSGDFCQGIEYRINWQNNDLPGGAKQTRYEVTVQNKTIPADTHIKSEDSPSTMFWIPSNWLAYENGYKWQVKVHIVSADGKCSWDLTSPWSSGGTDINIPHRYPVPKMTIKNDSGDNCFSGKCLKSQKLTFDGSTSVLSTSNPKYDWTVNGVAYSGSPLSQSFSKADNTAKLRVTDSDGHSCVGSDEKFILGDSTTDTPATWDEIAPR